MKFLQGRRYIIATNTCYLAGETLVHIREQIGSGVGKSNQLGQLDKQKSGRCRRGIWVYTQVPSDPNDKSVIRAQIRLAFEPRVCPCYGRAWDRASQHSGRREDYSKPQPQMILKLSFWSAKRYLGSVSQSRDYAQNQSRYV